MFDSLPPLLALVLGLALLVKGADWLVDGGVRIAGTLGLSPVMVGLTIIAWGTSLPELLVSTVAAADGRPGLALGNALGSNIANIGLVLGVTAILLPGVLGNALRLREAGWLLVSLLGLFLVLLGQGGVSFVGGSFLIGLFVIHNIHLWKTAKAGKEEESQPKGKGVMRRALLLVLAASVSVAIGAELTVTGAEAIARSIGVSDRVIGLSVIAIGTSLPELAAGVVSALKGQTEIGLGNVVGSNVFNVLVAVGAAGMVKPFAGESADAALWQDIPAVLLFSLAVILLPRLGPSGRWKGFTLTAAYGAFLWVQF
jgi:cation:H+ antiporter